MIGNSQWREKVQVERLRVFYWWNDVDKLKPVS